MHSFCRAATTDYHGTERTLGPPSSGTQKLESRYHGAMLLPKALGQDPSSPLPAPGGSKCSLVCGYITPVMSQKELRAAAGDRVLNQHLSKMNTSCLLTMATASWITAAYEPRKMGSLNNLMFITFKKFSFVFRLTWTSKLVGLSLCVYFPLGKNKNLTLSWYTVNFP